MKKSWSLISFDKKKESAWELNIKKMLSKENEDLI